MTEQKRPKLIPDNIKQSMMEIVRNSKVEESDKDIELLVDLFELWFIKAVSSSEGKILKTLEQVIDIKNSIFLLFSLFVSGAQARKQMMLSEQEGKDVADMINRMYQRIKDE